ncbi:hypothetical protein ACOME3_000909 [Neoechinorhynchus agilis]
MSDISPSSAKRPKRLAAFKRNPVELNISNISSDDEEYQQETCDSMSFYSDSRSDSGQSDDLSTPKSSSSRVKSSKDSCGICLTSSSSSINPILKCSKCSKNVHKFCYGVSEESMGTKTWLCDPCKDGNLRPHCELCPNENSGVLKRTNTKRYCHLICAIFIQHLTQSQLRSIGYIDLDSIPNSQYTQPPCKYCTDQQVESSGVRVRCESGTCKTAFHVTCGYQRGLIGMPSKIHDEPESNCMVHAEKLESRKRRIAVNEINANLAFRIKEVQNESSKLIVNHNVIEDGNPCRINRTRDLVESVFLAKTRKRRLVEYEEMISCDDLEDGMRVFPSISDQYYDYVVRREEQIAELQSELDDSMDLLARLLYESEKTSDFVNRYRETQAAAMIINEVLQLCDIRFEDQSRIGYATRRQILIANNGGNEEVAKISQSINEPCEICKKSNWRSFQMECSTCHKKFDKACLNPPLDPLADDVIGFKWICPPCVSKASGGQDEHLEHQESDDSGDDEQ